MKIRVREAPKQKIEVSTHDADGKLRTCTHSAFLVTADYAKAAKSLGTAVALLHELVARHRAGERTLQFDTNAVPATTFRVRGLAGTSLTLHHSLQLAMSAATPQDVVEWDANTHYCVLDLDFHDNNAPACNDLYAAAAALRPTPQQYWLSRSCGLHAIYMSIDPFTAVELAAVAAYQLQRRFPEARIEFLSRTRAYPAGTTPVVCTPDASMHGANPLLMRHDAIDATHYLETNDYAIGHRYPHTLCPVNPHERAVTNTPPVCVRESGIHCYICEADGIYRGSQHPGFFPYYSLLGTQHESVLATCIDNYAHWGHAQHVMQQTIRDPFHARQLYAALLKARHGEDERIPSVFTAGEPLGIVRQDGYWATHDGSILDLTGDNALIHSLPHARDAVSAAWLTQTVDLTACGYPPVRPVRGLSLTQNQPRAGTGILSVIPADVDPQYRPAYVPAQRRADVELAWRTIETVFPDLNRDLITLLIVGAGCVEQRAGLPPMMILHGPTGVGKTSHVELAAAIVGDRANIVRYNRDYDRFSNAIISAKQAGRYVLFDEFFKTVKQANIDTTVAMESLLSFNESTRMYMIYVGSVPLGTLPMFVWTDSEIPQEVMTHAQIGRRVHVCKLHTPLTWTDTLPAHGLYRIGALRGLGREYASVCDTVLSDVMDTYFTDAPCEFACVARSLGFARLQDSDARVERTEMIRTLYNVYLASPVLTDPSHLRRWSKPGYKLVDGILRDAFEALQSSDEVGGPDCRRLDDMILQTELGLPTPVTCERTKAHGRYFCIRFLTENAL